MGLSIVFLDLLLEFLVCTCFDANLGGEFGVPTFVDHE